MPGSRTNQQHGRSSGSAAVRPPETISSRRNPRVVAARKLTQRKHRLQQGRFLVEGHQLIWMGLEAGARPREVFWCAEAAAGDHTAELLLERAVDAGAAVIGLARPVMEALAQRDEPQALLATFDLLGEQADTAGRGMQPGSLVVVLDRLQDPGNIGTLIRTADAVGAAAVGILEPSVDPFDPKAVRGSMGSLFNVPLVFADDAAALLRWAAAGGRRLVGADATGGVPWGEGLMDGGLALVLGNEARGLSEDVAALVAERARLPIAGRAESLNVAVAGGVLMYAWLRRKLAPGGAPG